MPTAPADVNRFARSGHFWMAANAPAYDYDKSMTYLSQWTRKLIRGKRSSER
jgi:hypothetical protein